MDRVLFKRYMEELQEMEENMEALNKAFGKLDSEFCGFYISTAIILPIEILEDALNDDAHWLSYFVHQKDQLRCYNKTDIKIGGKNVEIKDWGNVYDFITGPGRSLKRKDVY